MHVIELNFTKWEHRNERRQERGKKKKYMVNIATSVCSDTLAVMSCVGW